MTVLSACMPVRHGHACPGRLEEDFEALQPELQTAKGLLYGCWELNLGPLKQQPFLHHILGETLSGFYLMNTATHR